jgi:glycosyltransferase involved in cell wall biosynthesis
VKVLHVAHSIASSYGGPTESLRGFAAAARATGAHVSIVAPRCSPADNAGLEDYVDAVHQFRSIGRNAFSLSLPLIQWLRNNVDQYDVVHVHGLFNTVSSIGARISIRRGVPTVIRPFGTLSRYTFAHRRTRLKQVWYGLVERRNLLSASAAHFTTEAERTEADRLGLDLGRRAIVVPPPFSPPPFGEKTEPREKTVLFLSRLHRVKNIEKLIDAWSIVSKRYNDWRLVIAGSGEKDYEASLRARASASSGAASIVFAGFLSRDAKASALSRSRVFVLPSEHENFGVSVLEALSSGLPAVVTAEVQLAPFIREHELGAIAPSEPGDLAKAISAAIEDEPLQKRVQQVGRAVVEKYFGIDAVGRSVIDMYRFAIQRTPATAPPMISRTT